MTDAQSNRFGSARSAELAEDRCDMEFDSMLVNRQARRNLFIGQPACEHLQDLAFTGCQRFGKLGEWARRSPGRRKSRIYLATMNDDKTGRCGLHSCNEFLWRRPGWQGRPDGH